jgi:hypothetical protein
MATISHAFQGWPVVPRISFMRRTMSATLSSSSRKRCPSLARSASAARLVATAYSSCRRSSSAPSLGLMMECGWATNTPYSHRGYSTSTGTFKPRRTLRFGLRSEAFFRWNIPAGSARAALKRGSDRLTTAVGVRRYGRKPMEFRRPVALTSTERDSKEAQRYRRSHTARVPTQNCTTDVRTSEPCKPLV